MIKGKRRWMFWAAWIAANAAGWLGLALVLITPQVGHAGERFWMPLSSAFILGLLQWAILNTYLDMDFTWTLAGMAAYGLMYYGASLASIDLSRILFGNPGASAVSDLGQTICLQVLLLAAGGWLQYQVLHQYTRSAWFWILLSPIAAAVAEVISLYVFNLRDLAEIWALTGCFYGLFTGAGIIRAFSRGDSAARALP